MKLIKQNVGDGLILKQNTDGKALKQNYNFGRAWKSYNPGAAYIDFSKIIIAGQPFSILFFHKQNNETAGVFQKVLGSNDNTTKIDYVMDSGAPNLQHRYNAVTAQVIRQNISAITFDGTTPKNLTSSNTLTQIGTKLIVDIPGLRTYKTGNVSTYLKINHLTIFDRALSLEELLYRKNNNLGNNLLNISQLWAEYPLNGAEILNIGGSDFVGIRDISGNDRHQPILSLPAGTLQEQMDWANANCFEAW